MSANGEVCIGEGDGFRLVRSASLSATAEVYMHFTREESLQFDEDAFPQIQRHPQRRF